MYILNSNGYNAFGTVKKNCSGCYNLPGMGTDKIFRWDDLRKQTKDLERGQYLSLFSKSAGLLVVFCKSNKGVALISTFHKSTDGATVKRFVKKAQGEMVQEELEVSLVLSDYNTTMTAVDDMDATTSATHYYRRNNRAFRQLFDYVIWGVMASNAWLLWRGLDRSRNQTFREFYNDVITYTLKVESPFLARRRGKKRNLLDEQGPIRKRFTGKEVAELSLLAIRNEMGPRKLDYDKNASAYGHTWRERARECMNYRPMFSLQSMRLCSHENCSSRIRWRCQGCGTPACAIPKEGNIEHHNSTHLGFLHVRYGEALIRLNRNL